jgi:hypothetical protein
MDNGVDQTVQLLTDPAAELAARNAQHAFWSAVFSWAYEAYFVLFGIGAALLVLHVFLPRDPGPQVLRGTFLQNLWHRLAAYRNAIGVSGLSLLLLLLALTQQRSIDDRRGFIADQEKRYEKAVRALAKSEDPEAVLRAQYLYMPEGNSLTYMSLGNTALAADYVWLTSMQYVSSSFRRGQKFDMLNRFYRTMLELDPHWTEAHTRAGKILSALERDRYKVENFYINAVTNNPDDLKLLEEAGRLFVVPPLDPVLQQDYSKRAVDWFTRLQTKLLLQPQTDDIKQQLIRVNDLIARLSIEAGAGYYLVAAEMLFKNATDKDSPEAMRTISARDWLNAQSYVIVNTLEKLLGEYKKRHGSFPPSLEPIFARLPRNGASFREDAFGFPIRYNAADGDVSSHGVNCRRALQVASVVNNFVLMFQGSENRLPNSLEELTSYVRQHYAQSSDGPSHAVLEALGPKLDCVKGPLGRWDYNPQNGQIKLPPECDLNVLYHNAADVLRLTESPQ